MENAVKIRSNKFYVKRLWKSSKFNLFQKLIGTIPLMFFATKERFHQMSDKQKFWWTIGLIFRIVVIAFTILTIISTIELIITTKNHPVQVLGEDYLSKFNIYRFIDYIEG